jgi:F-type H+-transporting ATPase subunit delta
MRGVSAEGRTAVLSVVDQQVRGGADATSLGNDLFAVVDVFDAQPGLRRMLTDPSSPVEAKSGLVSTLFLGKIDDGAYAALVAAAVGRWNSARDLSDALEDAGVEAHLAGAELAGAVDDVEDELFRFSRVVHGDPGLRTAISDRALPLAHKRDLLGSLLEGRAHPATVALVKQAVAARRRPFELTLEDYVETAAARRDELVATVRAAYDLDLDQRQRLSTALQGVYGKTVHLNVVVEPTLLGGATIEIGDELIDSSVAGRLEQARRKMTG